MPCFQAVVWPIAGFSWVKVTDFTNETQDTCTIAARFLANFWHGAENNWCADSNVHDEFAAHISPNNQKAHVKGVLVLLDSKYYPLSCDTC